MLEDRFSFYKVAVDLFFGVLLDLLVFLLVLEVLASIFLYHPTIYIDGL